MEEVINDPVLGRLTYDDAGEWYEGEAEITHGHKALVFVCPDEDVPNGSTVAAVARRSLARLRLREANLRRVAAEQLVVRDSDRVTPRTVKRVAALLRVGAVYFFASGWTGVDWDADPPLLSWSSANWVSHVGPRGGCRKIGWEHE